MDRKKISLILLGIFIIVAVFSAANLLLNDKSTTTSENGTLEITDSKSNQTRNVSFEVSGECLEVYDANTIWVYGVGKVQLIQVGLPEKNDAKYADAKKFTEEMCLGKVVYLDIDDANPKDKYDRALAIVYVNGSDVNKELINRNLAEISYFEPSEFKKGEI